MRQYPTLPRSGGIPAGPWCWNGHATRRNLVLSTVRGGRITILDFSRWGMSNAEPRFQKPPSGKAGVMINGRMFLKFATGNPAVTGVTEALQPDSDVYDMQIRDIDHPVARLMRLMPEFYSMVCEIADSDFECLQPLRDRANALIAEVSGDGGSRADAV